MRHISSSLIGRGVQTICGLAALFWLGAAFPVAAAAQPGATLCEQILTADGARLDAATAVHGQAGLGWNAGPVGLRNQYGSGPITQFTFFGDLLFAREQCDDEGGVDYRLVSHGARVALSLADAFHSAYSGATEA